MAGTGWDSSDLLTRFNAYAGRPSSDSITDAQKYQRLADGQNAVLVELMGVSPKVLYGAPTAMTSADGGYTWTFGTDGNGYALFPLGNAQIYPNLNAVPDYPWVPGRDYLDEGTRIRMPNNVAWSGTLYWRGVTPPQAIDATVQPVLQPPPSRILIVIKGVQIFANEYLRNAALSDQMQIEWDKQWPKQATMLRKHFQGARTLGPLVRAGVGNGFGGGSVYGW